MQDKLIDIETLEGDKLIVSLCCNYPFIKDALPADYVHITRHFRGRLKTKKAVK